MRLQERPHSRGSEPRCSVRLCEDYHQWHMRGANNHSLRIRHHTYTLEPSGVSGFKPSTSKPIAPSLTRDNTHSKTAFGDHIKVPGELIVGRRTVCICRVITIICRMGGKLTHIEALAMAIASGSSRTTHNVTRRSFKAIYALASTSGLVASTHAGTFNEDVTHVSIVITTSRTSKPRSSIRTCHERTISAAIACLTIATKSR